MPTGRSTALGILLPLMAVGVGLLLPPSTTASLLIPATFVISGALIGRWWAFLPGLAVTSALSVAELVGVHHDGAAIELHGGSFDLGFLLVSSSLAVVLAPVGAAARVAISTVLGRRW